MVETIEQQLRTLMLAGMGGDSRAQHLLLQKCGQRLRAYYARRVFGDPADAEDLVQETLIAVHVRRASYDPGQPFTAWLHAIARYKLIDHLRRSGRGRQVSIDDIDDAVFASAEDGGLGAAADIAVLMAGLPAKQREAIRLTKLEDLSVAEASERSGQSPSAIKVGVHRGLKTLMAKVRGRDDDDYR